MRAAHEVALVDAPDGADALAGAAPGAFTIINGGQIVHQVDGSFRAVLLTLSAGDTAVGAEFAHGGTLVVIGALHRHPADIGDQADNVIRALPLTNAASHALARVHMRHAVRDADGVMRADPCILLNLHNLNL